MRSKANAQYMVGIPRDSAMYSFYQAEAAQQGVKMPTHIYQLLKDRYEALQGSGQAVWFPRGVTVSINQQEQAAPVVEQRKVSAAILAFGGEDED